MSRSLPSSPASSTPPAPGHHRIHSVTWHLSPGSQDGFFPAHCLQPHHTLLQGKAFCRLKGRDVPGESPTLLIWAPPSTLPRPTFCLGAPASLTKLPAGPKGSAPSAPSLPPEGLCTCCSSSCTDLPSPFLSLHSLTCHARRHLLWEAFSASLPLPIRDWTPCWAPMIPCTSPMPVCLRVCLPFTACDPARYLLEEAMREFPAYLQCAAPCVGRRGQRRGEPCLEEVKVGLSQKTDSAKRTDSFQRDTGSRARAARSRG